MDILLLHELSHYTAAVGRTGFVEKLCFANMEGY